MIQSIKLVFSTFKVRNMFSVKDSVPQSFRSRVFNKFTCADCNACYIGETTGHICTPVREHLVSDKASHVQKPLQSSGTSRDSCSAESFKALDFAASSFQVKMKEALYIKWEIPTLNQQLRHLDLSLSVSFFLKLLFVVHFI